MALHGAHDSLLVYERAHGSEQFTIILNLTSQATEFEPPRPARHCRLLLSTLPGDPPVGRDVFTLAPNEGVILA
jgi:hypothetical protein